MGAQGRKGIRNHLHQRTIPDRKRHTQRQGQVQYKLLVSYRRNNHDPLPNWSGFTNTMITPHTASNQIEHILFSKSYVELGIEHANRHLKTILCRQPLQAFLC